MFRVSGLAWLIVALCPAVATAQSVEAHLAWDPSPDSSVQGYTLEYGTKSGSYSHSINVGPVISATVRDLKGGTTYYFAVRAYDIAGVYSPRSNEVSFTTPLAAQSQQSKACTLTLTNHAQSVTAFGGTGSFSALIGSGCPWTMNSSAGWLTVETSSGSGSQVVTYRVAANMAPVPRTAIIYSEYRSVVVTQPARVRGDFNGDGHRDLVWQNRYTGELSVWRMKGADIDRGDYLSPANVGDSDWKIMGTMDADKDGYTDILFQHDAGHVAIWRMQGETRIENIALSSSVTNDPSWRIVGTGDMDRDGFEDIFWQHSDGRVAVWYMNGTTLRESSIIAVVSDARWRVTAIEDFNGDGKLDILWRHTTWGQFLAWNMDDRQYLSSNMRLIMANFQWQVAAVGDYNGDNEADLIWWNSVTGELAAWFVKDGQVMGSRPLKPGQITDTNWRIAGPR
jgi:hypothetical protein